MRIEQERSKREAEALQAKREAERQHQERIEQERRKREAAKLQAERQHQEQIGQKQTAQQETNQPLDQASSVSAIASKPEDQSQFNSTVVELGSWGDEDEDEEGGEGGEGKGEEEEEEVNLNVGSINAYTLVEYENNTGRVPNDLGHYFTIAPIVGATSKTIEAWFCNDVDDGEVGLATNKMREVIDSKPVLKRLAPYLPDWGVVDEYSASKDIKKIFENRFMPLPLYDMIMSKWSVERETLVQAFPYSAGYVALLFNNKIFEYICSTLNNRPDLCTLKWCSEFDGNGNYRLRWIKDGSYVKVNDAASIMKKYSSELYREYNERVFYSVFDNCVYEVPLEESKISENSSDFERHINKASRIVSIIKKTNVGRTVRGVNNDIAGEVNLWLEHYCKVHPFAQQGDPVIPIYYCDKNFRMYAQYLGANRFRYTTASRALFTYGLPYVTFPGGHLKDYLEHDIDIKGLRYHICAEVSMGNNIPNVFTLNMGMGNGAVSIIGDDARRSYYDYFEMLSSDGLMPNHAIEQKGDDVTFTMRGPMAMNLFGIGNPLVTYGVAPVVENNAVFDIETAVNEIFNEYPYMAWYLCFKIATGWELSSFDAIDPGASIADMIHRSNSMDQFLSKLRGGIDNHPMKWNAASAGTITAHYRDTPQPKGNNSGQRVDNKKVPTCALLHNPAAPPGGSLPPGGSNLSGSSHGNSVGLIGQALQLGQNSNQHSNNDNQQLPSYHQVVCPRIDSLPQYIRDHYEQNYAGLDPEPLVQELFESRDHTSNNGYFIPKCTFAGDMVCDPPSEFVNFRNECQEYIDTGNGNPGRIYALAIQYRDGFRPGIYLYGPAYDYCQQEYFCQGDIVNAKNDLCTIIQQLYMIRYAAYIVPRIIQKMSKDPTLIAVPPANPPIFKPPVPGAPGAVPNPPVDNRSWIQRQGDKFWSNVLSLGALLPGAPGAPAPKAPVPGAPAPKAPVPGAPGAPAPKAPVPGAPGAPAPFPPVPPPPGGGPPGGGPPGGGPPGKGPAIGNANSMSIYQWVAIYVEDHNNNSTKYVISHFQSNKPDNIAYALGLLEYQLKNYETWMTNAKDSEWKENWHLLMILAKQVYAMMAKYYYNKNSKDSITIVDKLTALLRPVSNNIMSKLDTAPLDTTQPSFIAAIANFCAESGYVWNQNINVKALPIGSISAVADLAVGGIPALGVLIDSQGNIAEQITTLQRLKEVASILGMDSRFLNELQSPIVSQLLKKAQTENNKREIMLKTFPIPGETRKIHTKVTRPLPRVGPFGHQPDPNGIWVKHEGEIMLVKDRFPKSCTFSDLAVTGVTKEDQIERAKNGMKLAYTMVDSLIKIHGSISTPVKYLDSGVNLDMFSLNNQEKISPITFALELVNNAKVGRTHMVMGDRVPEPFGMTCIKDLDELLFGGAREIYEATRIFLLSDKVQVITSDTFPWLRSLIMKNSQQQLGVPTNLSSLPDFNIYAQNIGKLLKYYYEYEFKSSFTNQFPVFNNLTVPRFNISIRDPSGYFVPDSSGGASPHTTAGLLAVNKWYMASLEFMFRYGGRNEEVKQLQTFPMFCKSAIVSTNEHGDDRKSIQSCCDLGMIDDVTRKIFDVKTIYAPAPVATTTLASEMMENILDCNIFPINVYSLNREIPLADLYNGTYAFDVLANWLLDDKCGLKHYIIDPTRKVASSVKTVANDSSYSLAFLARNGYNSDHVGFEKYGISKPTQGFNGIEYSNMTNTGGTLSTISAHFLDTPLSIYSYLCYNQKVTSNNTEIHTSKLLTQVLASYGNFSNPIPAADTNKYEYKQSITPYTNSKLFFGIDPGCQQPILGLGIYADVLVNVIIGKFQAEIKSEREDRTLPPVARGTEILLD